MHRRPRPFSAMLWVSAACLMCFASTAAAVVGHAGSSSTASIVATVIPEPTTALLLGFGLTGLAWQGRRERR